MNLEEVFIAVPGVIQEGIALYINLINTILSLWGQIGMLEGFQQLGGIPGILEMFLDMIWII